MQSILEIKSSDKVKEITFRNTDIQSVIKNLDRLKSHLLVELDSKVSQFDVEISLKLTFSPVDYA